MAVKNRPAGRFGDFRIVPDETSKRSKKKRLSSDAAAVSRKLNILVKSRQYDLIKIDGKDYVQVRDKKSNRTLSKFRVEGKNKDIPVRTLHFRLSPSGTISPRKIFKAI